MKIKCPICAFEFDEGHSDNYILGHIIAHYSKLIQKIHEKISEWEARDADTDYRIVDDLKSLLENEK